MTDTTPIKIKINNKEYFIKCPVDKQAELIKTATFINSKIKNYKNSGLSNYDATTLVATLNFTNDLLQEIDMQNKKLHTLEVRVKELERTILDLKKVPEMPFRKPNISLEELL